MHSYSHWLLSHSWKHLSGCSIFYDTPITDTVKELVFNLHKALEDKKKSVLHQSQKYGDFSRPDVQHNAAAAFSA